MVLKPVSQMALHRVRHKADAETNDIMSHSGVDAVGERTMCWQEGKQYIHTRRGDDSRDGTHTPPLHTYSSATTASCF